jgi:hypothetical protein
VTGVGQLLLGGVVGHGQRGWIARRQVDEQKRAERGEEEERKSRQEAACYERRGLTSQTNGQ